MAASNIVTGARAKLAIDDPNKGTSGVIGIFHAFSWSAQLGAFPLHLIGRFSPDQIVYTHSEPVNFSASAYRSIHHGPHQSGSVPPLDLLLTADYLTLTLIDRVLDKANDGTGGIAIIKGVRMTGYNAQVSAKGVMEYTITGIGIKINDEDTVQEETPGSTSLP